LIDLLPMSTESSTSTDGGHHNTRSESGPDCPNDRPPRIQIRRVLLVSNPYAAFLLEEAGYHSAENASSDDRSAPIFDLVRTGVEALDALDREPYQMLIIEHVLPDMTGAELRRRAKERHPQVCATIVTGDTDMGRAVDNANENSDLFISYGSPSFWRALVRLHEDEQNAAMLLDSGETMALLLVEDEPNFYSHFIPALYDRMREAAIELLPEHRRPRTEWQVSDNRPLLLLRRTYEDACQALVRYEGRLTALMTDLCFPVEGRLEQDAGLRLLNRARALHGHFPVVVASRNREHEEWVQRANAKFLWKDSPHLLSELDSFLTHYCGFGPFVFRWPGGRRYGLAASLQDLCDLLADVPDVVFEHHALHQDFSTWLAVHGYQLLARQAKKLRITEPDLRGKLLSAFRQEMDRARAE
jgi:CheY-like chemotaxis protein